MLERFNILLKERQWNTTRGGTSRNPKVVQGKRSMVDHQQAITQSKILGKGFKIEPQVNEPLTVEGVSSNPQKKGRKVI